MKNKDNKKLKLKDWLKHAKEYAKKHPEIIIPDEFDFWDTVQVYRKYNFDTDMAVRAAVLLFKN